MQIFFTFPITNTNVKHHNYLGSTLIKFDYKIFIQLGISLFVYILEYKLCQVHINELEIENTSCN